MAKRKKLHVEKDDSRGIHEVPYQNDEARKRHKALTRDIYTHEPTHDMDELEEEISSSSSEEEDEVGELMTPELDAQILRTISLIRSNDPVVYDASQNFFDESHMEEIRQKWKERQTKMREQAKKVTIKDYEREAILLQMDNDGNNSYHDDDASKDNTSPKLLTTVEKQESIRQELVNAFHIDPLFNEDHEDDIEEEGGLFRPRIPSHDQIKQDEEEYRKFLLAEEEKGREKRADELAALRRYWKDPNLNDDERFLRDYILRRGWIDMDNQASIPTYDEVLEAEDAEAIEKADEFERQYNFRFEESDGTYIQTFPRTLDSTLRRKSDKRKEERQRRKQQKTEKKKKKIEEIKHLKNLKKKEILNKLKKISKISDSKLEGLEHLELDKEFDPDQFDQYMKQVFNDDYYQSKEYGDDPRKPKFDHDPTIDNEDAPNDEDHKSYEVFRRNKAGKSIVMDPFAITQQQPELQEYLDDYDQIGYEDIIGDMPTRFKYHKVPCASYGLTAEDILMADDHHLNAYMSIKKFAPYRPPEREQRYLCKYSNSSKRLQTLHEATATLDTRTATTKLPTVSKRSISSSSISQSRLYSYNVKKKNIT